MADDVTAPRPTKKPLLPRWLKFVLMLLGALFLVAALLWVIADISTRDALEAEIAELRAQGYPTTLEDLQWPAIPNSKNAAFIYKQAYAQQRDLDEKADQLLWKLGHPDMSEDLDETELAYLEARLQENEQALALLHQAAQTPKCQFHVVLLDDPWINLLAFFEWHSVMDLAVFATRLSVARGRGEEALRYWQDAIAGSRAARYQRIVLADGVSLARTPLLTYTLKLLLQSGLLHERQLEQALGTLDALEARDSLVSAIRGQLAVELALFDDRPGYPPFDGGISKRLRGLPLTWKERLEERKNWVYRTWLSRPARQYDKSYFVRFVGRLAPLYEEPFYKVRAQREQLAKEAAQVHVYLPLSRFQCARLLEPLEAQAGHEARVASARAAVALEVYRKRHGEYPKTLAILAPGILPAVPIDPFDGQPLRYVSSDERVAVYSIGEDLQDDGGSTERDTYGDLPDIVFTLRRAPTRTEEPDNE